MNIYGFLMILGIVELEGVMIFFAQKAKRQKWFQDAWIPAIHGRWEKPIARCHLSCIWRISRALTQSWSLIYFINGRTFDIQFTLIFFSISFFLLSSCSFELSFLLSHLQWVPPVFAATLFIFFPIGFFELPFKLIEHLFGSLRIGFSLTSAVSFFFFCYLFLVSNF